MASKKRRSSERKIKPQTATERNGQTDQKESPHKKAASRGQQPAIHDGVVTYAEHDVLSPEWFWEPWIARHIYTLLVGPSSCGKSTFLAYLTTLSKSIVYLPGEEDIRRDVLPRVLRSRTDAEEIFWVPPSERWMLPGSRQRLTDLVKDVEAKLVIIDPVDSYFHPEYSEDSNQHVRHVLDILMRVSEATGAAIVIVRHPGKRADNLLAGSRAWRTHPRAILQMDLTDDNRTGILRVHKPPFGRQPDPRYYHLVGLEGEPLQWALAGSAPMVHAYEAAEVTDRLERRKIDEACTLLTRLLAGGNVMDVREVYRFGRSVDISERTMRYAADRLSLLKHYEGQGGDLRSYWRLPPKKA